MVNVFQPLRAIRLGLIAPAYPLRNASGEQSKDAPSPPLGQSVPPAGRAPSSPGKPTPGAPGPDRPQSLLTGCFAAAVPGVAGALAYTACNHLGLPIPTGPILVTTGIVGGASLAIKSADKANKPKLGGSMINIDLDGALNVLVGGGFGAAAGGMLLPLTHWLLVGLTPHLPGAALAAKCVVGASGVWLSKTIAETASRAIVATSLKQHRLACKDSNEVAVLGKQQERIGNRAARASGIAAALGAAVLLARALR